MNIFRDWHTSQLAVEIEKQEPDAIMIEGSYYNGSFYYCLLKGRNKLVFLQDGLTPKEWDFTIYDWIIHCIKDIGPEVGIVKIKNVYAVLEYEYSRIEKITDPYPDPGANITLIKNLF